MTTEVNERSCLSHSGFGNEAKNFSIAVCGMWAPVCCATPSRRLVTDSFVYSSSISYHDKRLRIQPIMAAAAVQANGFGTTGDWPDRYFHVDQILDKPGPRTDPSFLAGDGVRD